MLLNLSSPSNLTTIYCKLDSIRLDHSHRLKLSRFSHATMTTDLVRLQSPGMTTDHQPGPPTPTPPSTRTLHSPMAQLPWKPQAVLVKSRSATHLATRWLCFFSARRSLPKSTTRCRILSTRLLRRPREYISSFGVHRMQKTRSLKLSFCGQWSRPVAEIETCQSGSGAQMQTSGCNASLLSSAETWATKLNAKSQISGVIR